MHNFHSIQSWVQLLMRSGWITIQEQELFKRMIQLLQFIYIIYTVGNSEKLNWLYNISNAWKKKNCNSYTFLLHKIRCHGGFYKQNMQILWTSWNLHADDVIMLYTNPLLLRQVTSTETEHGLQRKQLGVLLITSITLSFNRKTQQKSQLSIFYYVTNPKPECLN